MVYIQFYENRKILILILFVVFINLISYKPSFSTPPSRYTGQIEKIVRENNLLKMIYSENYNPGSYYSYNERKYYLEHNMKTGKIDYELIADFDYKRAPSEDTLNKTSHLDKTFPQNLLERDRIEFATSKSGFKFNRCNDLILSEKDSPDTRIIDYLWLSGTLFRYPWVERKYHQGGFLEWQERTEHKMRVDRWKIIGHTTLATRKILKIRTAGRDDNSAEFLFIFSEEQLRNPLDPINWIRTCPDFWETQLE